MWRFFSYFFFFTLFANFSTVGQSAFREAHPVFKKISYPFLPALSFFKIFFTKDGLLWFASNKGLVCFDGASARYYGTTEEIKQFRLDKIKSIIEDSKGNLYIASNFDVVYFERSTSQFTRLNAHLGIGENDVGILNIHIDKKGIVYLGAYGRGLYVYDPINKKTRHFNLDTTKKGSWYNRNFNTVSCFTDHVHPNLIWVGTYNGIYCFDKKSNTLQKNFRITTPQYNAGGIERSYYDVQRMELDGDSVIWFNIWSGGICHYAIRTGQVTIYGQTDTDGSGKPTPEFVLPSFVSVDTNQIFLGIERPRYGIFNKKTRTISYYSVTDESYGLDAIRYCTKDPSGNIWLIRNGLLYVSIPPEIRLQHLDLRHTLQIRGRAPIMEPRGIYYDDTSKEYYVACRFTNGIFVLSAEFKFLRFLTGINCRLGWWRECGTDRITKDGSGRLWATGHNTYITPAGKTEFQPLLAVYPQMKDLLKHQPFQEILTTSNGNIVLQSDERIFLIDHRSMAIDSFEVPRIANPLQLYYTPSMMSYDKRRDFLYCSREDGLARLDLQSKIWTVVSHGEAFGLMAPNKKLIKHTTDAEGRLWLLQDPNGVRILDPDLLKCTLVIGGNDSAFVQEHYTNIVSGNRGYMFLHGLHGVLAYDYINGKSFLLDHTTGLSNPMMYGLLSANGYLFAGQANRLEYFNPAAYFQSSKERPTYLSIHIQPPVDSTIWITSHHQALSFRYKFNNLNFSYSSLDHLFPERIEYAYKLDGLNETWTYTNYLNRQASYTNLKPGSYAFQLKKRIAGEPWPDGYQELRFTIHPPFWKTSTFNTAVLIAGVALTLLLFRFRIRYIRKQERRKLISQRNLLELEAKALRAQMNPHFIFNCLNSIKALIQNDEKKKSIEYLTTFSKLIRTLLNNADKRQISLYDELETCKLYLQLESMRLDGKLEYRFSVDENIDTKSVMVPALIIQPFIENAIWHGIVPNEKGQLTIRVYQQHETIFCEVDDDGIGRTLSFQNKQAGMALHESKAINLSQARLQLENILSESSAQIKMVDKYESERPMGTKVIISFNTQS